MLDSTEKAALKKKAYEIAYAFFRVAPSVSERGIAESFRSQGFRVLETVAGGDYSEAQRCLEVLDYATKFAMDLNLINFSNGEALIKQIAHFSASIAGHVDLESKPVDASSFFSEIIPANSPEDLSSRDFLREEKVAVSRAEDYENDRNSTVVAAQVFREENSHSEDKVAVGGFLKSGMRQIAILDKIRQSGNCRLRDIQEILPDSSERTLRYDLEGLMERKLIERVGNGGPSVFYRMRQ